LDESASEADPPEPFEVRITMFYPKCADAEETICSILLVMIHSVYLGVITTCFEIDLIIVLCCSLKEVIVTRYKLKAARPRCTYKTAGSFLDYIFTMQQQQQNRREGQAFEFLSIYTLYLRDARLAYKNKGLKPDELRRRREDQQVEIRRQKREENISKRRNFLPSTGADSDEEYTSGALNDNVVSHVCKICLFLHDSFTDFWLESFLLYTSFLKR
jgi:hypothetical protein